MYALFNIKILIGRLYCTAVDISWIVINTEASPELWISSTRELIYEAISKVHTSFLSSEEVRNSSLNLGKTKVDADLTKSIITYIRAQRYISAETESKLEEILSSSQYAKYEEWLANKSLSDIVEKRENQMRVWQGVPAFCIL